MNFSPIKTTTMDLKEYPSPINKKMSNFSVISSFQTATINLSPSNFTQWYSIAANVIKMIDFPITHEMEFMSSNLKSLPSIIMETVNKPIVTEGIKSTCGVILNLLMKAGFVEEEQKEFILEFLTSIFKQFLPKKIFNSNQRMSERTIGFEDIKDEGFFSEKKKQYGFDCFMDICKLQNEKNLTVNVCDEYGRFSK